MNILALEGALGCFSCALIAGRREFTEQLEAKVALERGLTLVQALLHRAELSPHELHRVAVGCGPGSFTGLRIALSYAKSLAQGWRLPLVAVSSFDVLEGDVTQTPLLTVVTPRTGVISARLRDRLGERRASGLVSQALEQLLDGFPERSIGVINASKDVLAALGERAMDVHILPCPPPPPALSLARMARREVPAISSHSVRADYGELPAAIVRGLP
ncbi:MAG: tRNA (adenosine(37)-N6)-threonylcarbamoyltransferase complex dimerization subunit type 1 TsaB [Candidatus Eremiobacteraeota bacterium]|nr:tRNA (adenosine(37)-N6)-threonylcarbamoyltransferase complex dimerization subunit type 1 TsaB [Candidatus Eremiobacteraeota bacterium]